MPPDRVMLSVISSLSYCGSRPDLVRAACTLSTNPAFSNWMADILTFTGTLGSPCSCHVLFWRHVSSKIHSPMGIICPLLSATPINVPGGTRPLLGWCQRISASTPVNFLSIGVKLGLVVHQEFLACDGQTQFSTIACSVMRVCSALS